jgi:hypothetical protein
MPLVWGAIVGEHSQDLPFLGCLSKVVHVQSRHWSKWLTSQKSGDYRRFIAHDSDNFKERINKEEPGISNNSRKDGDE